jgi:hypothetical protein
MTNTIDLCNQRELLMAMAGDLRTNAISLTILEEYYGLFRFMGGKIPPKALCLDALSAYQKCLSKESSISTATIDRYRFLAQSIMDLEQATSSSSSPRSLRNRKVIADKFDRATSEIREVETALESALTTLADESKPSLLQDHSED